jgi:hypothetical protein
VLSKLEVNKFRPVCYLKLTFLSTQFSDPRVERVFINAAKVEQQFVADSRHQADDLAMNLMQGRQTSVITVDRFMVKKTAYVCSVKQDQ